MKKLMASVLFAATMGAFFTSCKKDKDADAGTVISSLTDTTGAKVFEVTYNSDNRPTRIVASTTTFDLFYDGAKLIRRTLLVSGTLTSVDSFFYDGNGRFSKVESYDASGNSQATTVFAYNGDNTLNSATVDKQGFGESDAIFEFTYNGGNLNTIKEQEKVLSTYRDKRLYEFLAFDGKVNPLHDIIQKYFPDQFNLLIFIWASSNNFTSMKQTDYNTSNGNVTGTFPITATYTYGSNGLPLEATTTTNGNTTRNTYHYTSL